MTRVTDAVGVMTYTWAGNAASGNAYRVRPVGALGRRRARLPGGQPAAREPAGRRRRLAAGRQHNLLNYFNTFDDHRRATARSASVAAPADCRGADNPTEFDRQWPKTVEALVEASTPT